MIIFNRDLPSIDYATTIWRYMSVRKFLSMLKTQSLYFRRADLYSDNKEVTLTLLDEMVMHTSRNNEYWKQERRRHYVSCWIEATSELSYMWEDYSAGGIAIESSVGRIIQSMLQDENHHVYIAPVKYVDFHDESTQDHLTPINVLKIPFTKSLEYAKENEVRLLYTVSDIPNGSEPESYNLPIDISKLIKKVWLHKSISLDDEALVRKELSKLNVDVSIEKSYL